MFEIKQFICIKMDLALNNLQRLICHKAQTNQPTNQPTSKKTNKQINTQRPKDSRIIISKNDKEEFLQRNWDDLITLIKISLFRIFRNNIIYYMVLFTNIYYMVTVDLIVISNLNMFEVFSLYNFWLVYLAS